MEAYESYVQFLKNPFEIYSLNEKAWTTGDLIENSLTNDKERQRLSVQDTNEIESIHKRLSDILDIDDVCAITMQSKAKGGVVVGWNNIHKAAPADSLWRNQDERMASTTETMVSREQTELERMQTYLKDVLYKTDSRKYQAILDLIMKETCEKSDGDLVKLTDGDTVQLSNVNFAQSFQVKSFST